MAISRLSVRPLALGQVIRIHADGRSETHALVGTVFEFESVFGAGSITTTSDGIRMRQLLAIAQKAIVAGEANEDLAHALRLLGNIREGSQTYRRRSSW